MSSYIRQLPFHHISSDDDSIDSVLEKLSTDFYDYQKVSMNMLKFEDKALLVEKHLISPLFTRQGLHSFINEDESASIMINEEDHIRIQTMGAGVPIRELYKEAEEIDESLEEVVDYAFDEHFGYLTACPTNVGTG